MEDKILEIIKEESENANVRKYTCVNGFGYSQFERNIAERVVKLFTIAGVVRPEVESAKEDELLATEAPDTATCGADDNGWNCKMTTEPGGVASQCMNGCILERSSCDG